MRKLLITTVTVLHVLLTSCTTDELISIPEEYNLDVINIEYTQMDYDIALLINEHRSSIGLAKLSMIDAISEQATSHSLYMVNKGQLSHDYFYMRSANLKEKVSAQVVSENVGFGFSTAKTLVKAWLESDEHRKNIENPNFTNIGISTKKDLNRKIYTTNIFVKQ